MNAVWWGLRRSHDEAALNVAKANIAVHSISHVGQRDENEDRLAVLGSNDEGLRLFVVADGLGGHVGGALAAQTVVDTAAQMSSPRSADPEEFMRGLVLASHAAVRRSAKEQALDARSTLAALLVSGSEATSVHVGDSRVMQYSATAFVGRTSDHSVAQLLVSGGELPEKEMAGHPAQAQLLSSVGGPRAPTLEVTGWDLAAGKRFVVCSDGFWSIFSHAEVLGLYGTDDPECAMRERLESKLQHLQDLDNCTAILVEIDR
ncbi:MAG: serine/threonine-protein phosphatase [Candidatus Tectomicrobia bacterium]|nr:serine/threonine-protein phosphatase [Candidatus Tectomicrobia bacterium]